MFGDFQCCHVLLASFCKKSRLFCTRARSLSHHSPAFYHQFEGMALLEMLVLVLGASPSKSAGR